MLNKHASRSSVSSHSILTYRLIRTNHFTPGLVPRRYGTDTAVREPHATAGRLHNRRLFPHLPYMRTNQSAAFITHRSISPPNRNFSAYHYRRNRHPGFEHKSVTVLWAVASVLLVQNWPHALVWKDIASHSYTLKFKSRAPSPDVTSSLCGATKMHPSHKAKAVSLPIAFRGNLSRIC